MLKVQHGTFDGVRIGLPHIYALFIFLGLGMAASAVAFAIECCIGIRERALHMHVWWNESRRGATQCNRCLYCLKEIYHYSGCDHMP